MFKQVCYLLKDKRGYYLDNDGDYVFEDSSAAKRFHTLKDVEKAMPDLENWSILEVEFGFRVIRTVELDR